MHQQSTANAQAVINLHHCQRNNSKRAIIIHRKWRQISI